MKIECNIKLKKGFEYGIERFDEVKITIEGDFQAIIKLCQKLNFNPLDPDIKGELSLE